MTEKEKKAIEYLENRLDILHNNTQLATENSIKVVLNLIDKQQKEIQSLENQLDFIGEQNKYIDRLEYLIKKKDAYIEELENWTKEHPSVIPMPEEIREEAEKLGHFADLVTIEEKKYISTDKIKDRIEQLESYYDISKETTPTSTNQFIIDVVAILEELLEE